MDKLLIFSLSILFFASGCGERKPDKINFDHLTVAQKATKTKELDSLRRYYAQGFRIRQAMFDSLIALNPQNEYYYREKSVAHSKIGDYHIAIPLLEKSASLNPSESLYYYSWLLSNLYHDYERALVKLQQYDDLTPGAVDYAWGENVNFLKGQMYKQLKQYDSAIREFDIYISTEGEGVDMYVFVYKGIAYLEKGSYNEALKDFETALSLYDKSSMAHYYKGLALLQLGDTTAAVESIRRARDLVAKGYKKADPYKEVYNEVNLMQIDDKLAEIK